MTDILGSCIMLYSCLHVHFLHHRISPPHPQISQKIDSRVSRLPEDESSQEMCDNSAHAMHISKDKLRTKPLINGIVQPSIKQEYSVKTGESSEWARELEKFSWVPTYDSICMPQGLRSEPLIICVNIVFLIFCFVYSLCALRFAMNARGIFIYPSSSIIHSRPAAPPSLHPRFPCHQTIPTSSLHIRDQHCLRISRQPRLHKSSQSIVLSRIGLFHVVSHPSLHIHSFGPIVLRNLLACVQRCKSHSKT